MWCTNLQRGKVGWDLKISLLNSWCMKHCLKCMWCLNFSKIQEWNKTRIPSIATLCYYRKSHPVLCLQHYVCYCFTTPAFTQIISLGGSINKFILSRRCLSFLTHSVITNITRCCSQVDDRSSLWTAHTKCVDMCHNIMSTFLLLSCSQTVVYIFQVGFHFLDLLICDFQP